MGNKAAGLIIIDDFARAFGHSSDDGYAAGHGFDNRKAERL